MLDLFDLDETFSSEKVRLAQLTNKCRFCTSLSQTSLGPVSTLSMIFGKLFQGQGDVQKLFSVWEDEDYVDIFSSQVESYQYVASLANTNLEHVMCIVRYARIN